MNYVESFNFYGVDAKEIPCIRGEGVPTTKTEGAVGSLYMNTVNGDLYKCVAINNGSYIWIELSNKADQTFDSTSENAQSGVAVDMAIKEAVENAKRDIIEKNSFYTSYGMQNHDLFFDVVTDSSSGTTINYIFLKPEYRGIGSSEKGYEYTISDNGVDEVGSYYDELPEMIKIPSTIKGKTINAMIAGLFLNNDRIKSVELPSGVKVITKCAFKNCKKLQSVHNTGEVTTIQESGFEATSLREAIFPKVYNIWEKAFKVCTLLKVAQFGATETNPMVQIRAFAFERCCSLEKLTGCSTVRILKDHALFYTFNLKDTDIGRDSNTGQTKVYENAIMGCGFDFDTAGVTLVKYDDNAQYCVRNDYIPIDTWISDENAPSYVTETHINPINKTFCQGDPKWSKRLLYGFDFSCGDKRVDKPTKYNYGCVIHSFMNAFYSILKGAGATNLPTIPYSADDSVYTIEKDLKERFGETVFSDYANWCSNKDSNGYENGYLNYYDENEKFVGKIYKNVTSGNKNATTGFSVNPYAIIEYLAREKMSDWLTVKQYYTYNHIKNNYSYNKAYDGFSSAAVDRIHDALVNGSYVLLVGATGSYTTGGHIVLAYGIEKNPYAGNNSNRYCEPLIHVIDTGMYHVELGVNKPIKYKLPLRYFTSTVYDKWEDNDKDGAMDTWTLYNYKKMGDDVLTSPSYIIVTPK